MLKLIICVFLVGYCSAERIIIIGAGAAGIATAARLLENNITDFRILEAEHRIGGRINSIHLGNASVDLGAQFVHGQEGNVVYQLSEEYVKHSREIGKALIYYGNTKRTVASLGLVDKYIGFVEDVPNAGSNITFGEAILNRYHASIMKTYNNDPKMLQFSKDLLRTFECLTLTADGAFSWFELASQSNFKSQKGDELMSWDGQGYETVLKLLLKNYPNKTGYNIVEQISLGTSVSKITLGNNTVETRCQDGSEYISDYVVFTPSLGVLKHDHKKLFEPELNKKKKEAIENLGIDVVMKIAVEFPTSWWGSQDDFVFVWDEEKKKNLIDDIRFGPVKNGDHWLSWFYYIGRAPQNSKVLIGWILGPMIPDIEKLTEQEMKTGILYAMRKFLSVDYDIPDPIRVIHTKWYTNPNFRGAYSFETIKSIRNKNPTDHEVLSQPINGQDGTPRILFAGEATSFERFATVDGAIETGYREGDRIVERLK